MYDIVALGEVLIDFTYYGISENGNALFEQNPGGAPANVLALAAGFGLKTAFIGKVGADMHGDFLRKVLGNKGIDISGLVTAEDVFTTLAFVKLYGGERSFSFARKPGADIMLTAGEVDFKIIKNTKIFHFGSLSLTDEPSKTALLAAIDAAKKAGAVISYDPNYRAPLWTGEAEAIEQMRSVVKFADIVKISDEETVLLAGETDPQKAVQILLAQGVQCAVVTLGADGALVANHEGLVHKKSPVCDVVDTTGAGDIFWGSFLYRLVQSGKVPAEHSLAELADYTEFANTAAGLCVGKRGAMPSMPELNEVLTAYCGGKHS